MASELKKAFLDAKKENRTALITYITNGFPSPKDTIPIMKSLQSGGVSVIELGVPFSDAVADGPTIQNAGNLAISKGVNLHNTLKTVKEARDSGVTVPIVLMGYFNPIFAYGEEKFVKDCSIFGVNGFIIVDLPPEEALDFRSLCTKYKLSYIPLVAPSTTPDRMEILAKIADSFVYVVSRMGVTGASSKVNDNLPEIYAKARKYFKDIPLAVGFGVSNREQYNSIGQFADGVVIGSKLVNVIGNAPEGKSADAAKAFVEEILGEPGKTHTGPQRSSNEHIKIFSDGLLKNDKVNSDIKEKENEKPKYQCGDFGGQFVPEILYSCLNELEKGFNQAVNDPTFWEEFRSYYNYIGRPSNLTYADRLTAHAGGAKIWLKREDLNHTGSHKINNALGQILIAKRLGKTRVIAETGAGQHGVATATIAAKFGMKCTVFMGAEDVRRQALNVFRIRLLGAEVCPVEEGQKTLREAVNAALRSWVTDLSTTHYVIGSAIGPHPYPTIVRTFQSVIGQETRKQMLDICGKLPDAVVACVGGGSNAVGMFYPFKDDPSVKMIGCEAGGEGLNSGHHSATLSQGKVGILHGVKSYLLQDEEGQIMDTHSISAGLDYPGVGPQLAEWKDEGRAKYIAVTDAQALEGFRLLSQLEGIIPALESSHAIYGALLEAKTMPKDQNLVICVSGRGDKDVASVAENLPKLGPQIGWDLRF